MEPEYKGYYIYTQDGTCNLFCIFEKIYSDKIKSKLGLNQMDRARFVKWIKDKKNNCVRRDMKSWLSDTRGETIIFRGQIAYDIHFWPQKK